MGYFRDALKALAWAVVAASLFFALAHSGWVLGSSSVLPLLAAPLVAFRWHHSGRIAGLVAVWLLVLGAVAVALFFWAIRDLQFRGPSG